MTPARIGKALPWIYLLRASPALAATLATFASFSALAADTETTLSVAATPNPVAERDSLQLQIEVDSPLTTVVMEPTFEAPDFIKAGSPEMKFQPHAGDFGPNTRKKLVFTFVLMPRHAGKFTIRHIATKAAGRPLFAPDISVTVTPNAAGPRPPAQLTAPPVAPTPGDDESTNPAAPNYRGAGAPPSAPPAAPPSAHAASSAPHRFNSDFTVWASVSKMKAYVGEPILVEYYLYDFGGLRQTEILQWPNFTGFWREDLELTSHIDFEEVFVDRQEARRAFIARYALYGIKPGRFELDKLGVRGRYVPSNILNPALFFNMDLRTGEHYSQPVNIEIVPLPEANRPANFGGAVGKFTLRLDADKKTLAQNTPVTLTFTLEGTGNFQAIEGIKAPLPPDFELYESTTNGRAPGPVGGRQDLASKKTFQTVAIPRKAGHFEIPPVSWSYFDPDKEAYETITTQAFPLEVTPSDSTSTVTNTYLSPDKSGAPPGGGEPGTELRYLKPVDLTSPGTGPDRIALRGPGPRRAERAASPRPPARTLASPAQDRARDRPLFGSTDRAAASQRDPRLRLAGELRGSGAHHDPGSPRDEPARPAPPRGGGGMEEPRPARPPLPTRGRAPRRDRSPSFQLPEAEWLRLAGGTLAPHQRSGEPSQRSEPGEEETSLARLVVKINS